MQYVEGRNVRATRRRTTTRSASALSITIQVTDALAAAHSRGIAHRDIKARNVMVTRSGTVKVLDFGLAKLIESPTTVSSDPQLTEIGVPYGTSTYAAPEQAQGLKADHRADIFSTGVLLYEMLAGTWPFRGKTALDVRYAVVYHKPKPSRRREVKTRHSCVAFRTSSINHSQKCLRIVTSELKTCAAICRKCCARSMSIPRTLVIP